MLSNSINELNLYGFPELKRREEINSKTKTPTEHHSLEFMGAYRSIPVIEVRIEFPVYRLRNGRTKTYQEEYIAMHPEVPADLFTKDHDSIDAQLAQHEILKTLIEEEGLHKAFKNDILHQTEPIICTNNGIVVNGNRRLCDWREIYYSDRNKYKHFETIRIAILPECDERAIKELEKRLQVQNQMRAKYRWHAIALMAKEELDQGKSNSEVAASLDMSAPGLKELISMLGYASKYLKERGTPHQWSLVNDEFAFREMVKGQKKLDKPVEKELFEKLAYTFIGGQHKPGRLYDLVGDIPENLPEISKALEEKLEIPKTELIGDDTDLLIESHGGSEYTANIIAAIRNEENQDIVRSTIVNIIETQKAIKQERDAENYLLNQVSKAAAILASASTIGLEKESINIKGVVEQINSIKESINKIQEWLDDKNESTN